MIVRVMCLFFLSSLVSKVAFSAESQDASKINSSRSSQMGYSFETSMLYLDSLNQLSKPALIEQQSHAALKDDDSQPKEARTLGLRQMKIGFDWSNPRNLKASVVLRPDGVKSNSTVVRELDTRSGVVQQPMEDIQLLDLYELSIQKSNFNFSLGVREKTITDEFNAYAPILDFSHSPRPPSKVFGAFVDMKDFFASNDNSSVDFSLGAIGDNNDRHSDRSKNEDVGDEGPTRLTPYWGFAASSKIKLSKSSQIGVGLSMSESKDLLGRNSSAFYTLGAKSSIAAIGQGVGIGFNVRQGSMRYKSSDTELSPTSLTESDLSTAWKIGDDYDFLFSFKGGLGKRQSKENLANSMKSKAFQFETGLRQWIGDGLQANGIITREYCQGDMEFDGSSGCFGLAGKRNTYISRMAVSIAYLTGGDL